MAPIRFLLASLLLVVAAACATGGPPEGPQPDYYVMRHLQKAGGPDPALSEEGKANAETLAFMLERRPPASIYVSTTRRAWETAAPLAARIGLTLKTYDPSNTAALVAAVKNEARPVLIVGHSNTVPDIVEGLGGTRPPDLADTDYGHVWRIFVAERRVERMEITRIEDRISDLPD
jgi:broad specificity phosphatase PhoE